MIKKRKEKTKIEYAIEERDVLLGASPNLTNTSCHKT